MKKSVFTKAIVALMVIAMLLPCVPVIASAEAPTVTTRSVTDADKAWYGDGSATEFTISTAGELAYFMELGTGTAPMNFLNKTVKLAADIVWNEGVASESGFTPSEKQGNVIYKWIPYSSQITSGSWSNFRGTFDGQGHTVSGLYVVEATSFLGFLGTMRGGKVKDLTVSNSYYAVSASKQFAGAVAGGFYGAGNSFTNVTVSNCHIDASKGLQNSNVGGICGGDAYASAKVDFVGCAVDAKTTLVGKAAMGGIMGSNRTTSTTTLTDCVSYATVSGASELGGLMGRVAGNTTFTRCYGLGTVKATSGAAWCGALASLRNYDNGTQADAATTEAGCKTVIFADCFYFPNANSTGTNPVAMVAMSSAIPGYKVVVRYSDVEGDVSSVAYFKESESVTNADTGAQKTMPALAADVKAQLHAYKNGAAALAVPAKGTDAVKVEGVQIKKNDSTYAARFLATVHTAEVEDISAVKSIGFWVSILGDYAMNGASAVQKQDCGAVYTSILSDYGMTTVTAAELKADYVGTLVIDKIPATGVQHLLVRAYYTTEGDAVCYSEAAVFTFVNGAFAGSSFLSTVNSDSTQGSVTSLGVSRNTSTYDLAVLLPESAEALVISENGVPVNGTEVELDIGANAFTADYTVQGIRYRQAIQIHRRGTYRVTFNSNGGSYIPAKQVAEGETLAWSSVGSPTRAGYEFLGWYNEEGEKIYLSSTAYTEDTVLYARWKSTVTSYSRSDVEPILLTTSSAAINVNWRDYGNAAGERPTEVFCTLKNTETGESYRVHLTEDNASFTDGAPAGAVIGQGAGKWTVKITGLTASYTFTQDPLGKVPYRALQSGTTVTNTYSKQYRPLLDDTAALYTANGRFYDQAGNVVILKGVVTVNVGTVNFVGNTGAASIARLRDEGVNCIRITLQLHDTTASNIGYLTTASGEAQTEERQQELKALLKNAVDTVTGLGLYCIVDWGVIGTDPCNYQSEAITFFSALAAEYLSNPYVLYEICNEPLVEAGKWHITVKPYCEAVIAAIRETGSHAVVIAAPNDYAKWISDYTAKDEASDDPIDRPIATELSYNVAYTLHVYAYNHEYNREDGNDAAAYGWRLKEALEAGLTPVLTEFSPATSAITAQSQGVTLASIPEAEKYLNVLLEYDVNYFLFRYISHFSTVETSSQHMFIRGNNAYLNDGTWTDAHLTEWGKWFLDAAVRRTGFIKVADFTPKTPA